MTTTFVSAFFWASVCAYHEAQGEPLEGQVAVVQVIMNRAIKRRQSVKEVITADDQFRDRKSTRLNSSHIPLSRMPSSA